LKDVGWLTQSSIMQTRETVTFVLRKLYAFDSRLPPIARESSDMSPIYLLPLDICLIIRTAYQKHHPAHCPSIRLSLAGHELP